MRRMWSHLDLDKDTWSSWLAAWSQRIASAADPVIIHGFLVPWANELCVLLETFPVGDDRRDVALALVRGGSTLSLTELVTATDIVVGINA